MTTIQFPEFEEEKLFEKAELYEIIRQPKSTIAASGLPPNNPSDYAKKEQYTPHVSSKLIELAKRVHEDANDNRARDLIKLIAEKYQHNPSALKNFYNHKEGVIVGLAKAANTYIMQNKNVEQSRLEIYMNANIEQEIKLGQEPKTYVSKDSLDAKLAPCALTKIIGDYVQSNQGTEQTFLPTTKQDALYKSLNTQDISYDLQNKVEMIEQQKKQNTAYSNFDAIKKIDTKQLSAEAYFTNVGKTL